MTDERQRQGREGFRAWLGVLDAFREAIDETIEEMRTRGDFSQDRAKDAVKSAMRRAEEAVDQARERLDFVPRREFDELRAEVDELRRRLEALEGGGRTGAGAGIPVEGE